MTAEINKGGFKVTYYFMPHEFTGTKIVENKFFVIAPSNIKNWHIRTSLYLFHEVVTRGKKKGWLKVHALTQQENDTNETGQFI